MDRDLCNCGASLLSIVALYLLVELSKPLLGRMWCESAWCRPFREWLDYEEQEEEKVDEETPLPVEKSEEVVEVVVEVATDHTIDSVSLL